MVKRVSRGQAKKISPIVARRANRQRAVQRRPRRNAPRTVRRVRAGTKSATTITPVGNLLRTAGTIAGAYFGAPVLGREAGAAISRIFGQGDYQIQSNSLVKGGPPAFAAMNTGIRIAHREFIRDITSSTGFASVTFDVNVADSTSFPWLNTIAQNFEEYSIKGIVYYFNTTCGSAISSTNNALGTVGMVTVYDPTDPALGTKRECEDYSGCVAGVPAQSLIHPIECKPRNNVLDRLYIQSGTLANPEDKKFYSHGTLNVFTQGMQAAGITLGELWVSYDIEFYNPKIQPIGTYGLAASRFALSAVGGAANTLMLGSSSRTSLGNLGVTYDTNGFLHLPRGTASGYYLVSYTCGTAPIAVAPQGKFTFSTTNVSGFVWCQNNASVVATGPGVTPTISNMETWAMIGMIKKTDSLEGVFRIEGTSAFTGAGVSWLIDCVISKLPTSAVSDLVVNAFNSSVSATDDELIAKLATVLERKGILCMLKNPTKSVFPAGGVVLCEPNTPSSEGDGASEIYERDGTDEHSRSCDCSDCLVLDCDK